MIPKNGVARKQKPVKNPAARAENLSAQIPQKNQSEKMSFYYIIYRHLNSSFSWEK